MRFDRWRIHSVFRRRNYLNAQELMAGCDPRRSRWPTSPAFRELCYSFARKSLSLPGFYLSTWLG
jgi:hypothetical protein